MPRTKTRQPTPRSPGQESLIASYGVSFGAGSALRESAPSNFRSQANPYFSGGAPLPPSTAWTPQRRRTSIQHFSIQDSSKLTAHPPHIVIAHRRKQGQSHRLAADPRRHRRVLVAIPQIPIIFEAGNAGIVHADADAAIGHDFLEPWPRHAARFEVDEQLKHVPAMARVAARRQ